MHSSLCGRRLFASLVSVASLTVALTIGGAAHAQVLISQVYSGGGSGVAGTTFNFDYVELYNNGLASVDLTGDSIQYASSTSTTISSTYAFTSGIIASHGYFLIECGSKGAAGGAASPAADAKTSTSIFSISNTAAKVFLASNSTAVTYAVGANTTATLSSNVLDFIGFGTGTNAYYGTGPAPTPTNTTTALVRALAGNMFVNSMNNAADFTNAPVSLHGTQGPVTAVATPEPASFALAGLGVLSFVGRGLRRRRA